MNLLALDHSLGDANTRAFWAATARALGWRVIVLRPSGGPTGLPGIPVRGAVAFGTIRALRASRVHQLVCPGLARAVRRTGASVLHLNTEPENLLAWQGTRLKAAVPGLRLSLVSWRNIRYPGRRLPYRLGRVYSAIERRTLKVADHIFCFNDDAVRILRSYGARHLSRVVTGVDASLFRPGPRTARRAFTARALTAGYAGRLVPEKGIDLLIRAASGLEDVNVSVLGSGPEKGKLVRLVREAGMGGRTRFLPARPQASLPAFYRSIDVLVLPSVGTQVWKEQFGRVLIEAMACGVPVIGSGSGEIPKVIGGAGLVFREGDVDGLKRCIKALRDGRGRCGRLGRAGRRRVLGQFTVRHMAESFAKGFRSLS
jgi:glycosyltransferase involved in cell wall biosynthesis